MMSAPCISSIHLSGYIGSGDHNIVLPANVGAETSG